MAFRELGHEAYSCDLQPCRKGGHPEWHIQGDVSPLLEGCQYFLTQNGEAHFVESWHLIIAHPPCTYLCKVGSPWMRQQGEINDVRYAQMKLARHFFFKCLNAKAPFVAVENPLPMAIAELPQPSCYIQPAWFGVKYTKKTLYWLRNLPPIWPEKEHPMPKCFVRASRGKYRARTFPQVATAIAHQWSEFIITELNKLAVQQ